MGGTAAGVHGESRVGREAIRSSFVCAGGLMKRGDGFVQRESGIRCWIVEKQWMHY